MFQCTRTLAHPDLANSGPGKAQKTSRLTLPCSLFSACCARYDGLIASGGRKVTFPLTSRCNGDEVDCQSNVITGITLMYHGLGALLCGISLSRLQHAGVRLNDSSPMLR